MRVDAVDKAFTSIKADSDVGSILVTCAAKSTRAASSVRQFIHFLANRAGNWRNDQLRDAHSMGHGKCNATQIDQRHLNFTTIIRINCAG